MTSKNSILLIIKQVPGIEYNALLNKIAANYATVNSARAALSRTLKDAGAFGLVEKRNNQLFLTEKGSNSISNEMKGKLLIKLNELVKDKDSVLEMDALVRNLATLIERSKQDQDLLKAARASVSFSLSDLNEITQNAQEQVKHLNYLINVLQDQASVLRSLDFPDSFSFALNEKTAPFIQGLPEKLNAPELSMECNDMNQLHHLAGTLNEKVKGTSIAFKAEQFPIVISWVTKSESLLTEYIFYFGFVKTRILAKKAVVSGPYSKIQEVKQFFGGTIL
ncbi:MAG: hypothetical protein HY393_01335 [Candidatus Diapherotrites archaeon]|nr:hypothetical protein [Candidatus Diapherotrites archaeon]